MFLRPLVLCVFTVLALATPGIVSAQILADVQVSGGVSGTFTVDLEYAKAPAAVANFIGLATGQRDWLDYATGAIRHEPYYNGVTFHRVIAGFMNQTGSRKGDGTDGPGYSFKDEFDPTLRHDAAYTVSMANSGKHTNGSQIFITAGATPWLNDVHTIFGHVISGQAICDAINATPTAAGDVPVTPIAIQGITVYGPSLAGFNLTPSTLPVVYDAHPILSKSGTNFGLNYDARSYSTYRGFHGTNLATWLAFKDIYFASAPVGQDDVTALATGARHFFRMARIDYGGPTNQFMPAGVGGKSFSFPNGFVFPVELTFNAAGTGGSWSLVSSGSGTIQSVTYTRGPYLTKLLVVLNSFANYGFNIQLLYNLDYTSTGGGTHTAQSNVSGWTSFSGTFTTAP
jgi:peptidyl-prolyl cis-trans isomerase A (cyclophilin A)